VQYFLPTALDDALARLSAPGARAVAGGTDLYPALGDGLPGHDLVDLTRIPELGGISHAPDGGHRLGATLRWSELVRAPLPPAFDALKAAAREVGSIQIQNAGTLAGNLCTASPAADGVPPLLALEAEVETTGPAGTRTLPLDRFLTGPRTTALAPGELVTAIRTPPPPAGAASAFLKLGSRRYLVISIAMVAALLWPAPGGRIAGARIAVGACSPTARRLPALEAAVTGLATADLAAPGLVTREHLAPLAPIDDVRGPAAYRLEAVAELCRRALLDAARRMEETAHG
jgi:CO/xanthine dehydrogenase FAD-binding subunit